MRWLLVVALLGACAPAVAAPVRTEDPRIAQLQAERDELARQVLAMTRDAAKPATFVMWDIPTVLPSGRAAAIGLPDTFTVRIQFTSTAPVRARIMDFDQYVAYRSSKSTDATMTYPPTTSLDVTFHDAERCGAYILVLDAERDAIVTPRIAITRVQPANTAYTGFCAR